MLSDLFSSLGKKKTARASYVFTCISPDVPGNYGNGWFVERIFNSLGAKREHVSRLSANRLREMLCTKHR